MNTLPSIRPIPECVVPSVMKDEMARTVVTSVRCHIPAACFVVTQEATREQA